MMTPTTAAPSPATPPNPSTNASGSPVTTTTAPAAAPADTSDLERELTTRPLPRHVAVIMDGNGRWAESRGKRRADGHREGSRAVRDVTRAARRVGVEALTLFAFSSENWRRPIEEVSALMDLLREYLINERDEIMDNGVRLEAIGELDRLPPLVREPLDRLRAESSRNRGMVLTLALSYGARDEIVRAAAALARAAAEGAIDPGAISEADLDARMWTAGLPPVDLIVRTSGEQRISNFLLWQAAYAELLFSETAWPDVTAGTFLSWLATYQQRERRFGRTGAQLRPRAP